MLNQLREKKKQAEGFTIIEVMIVLVIAAVIILIVFLAVPALQRNSRNNQRKNDIGRMITAVKEWQSNNNQAWPANDTDRTEIYETAGDLAFFKAGSEFKIAHSQSPPSVSYEKAETFMRWFGLKGLVYGKGECSDTSISTGNKHIAIYLIETGSGEEITCTEG